MLLQEEKMKVYDELVARGLIAQTTDEEEIKLILSKQLCKIFLFTLILVSHSFGITLA